MIGTDDGDRVVDALHARGLHPEMVLVRRATLEDVFLRLDGPEADRLMGAARRTLAVVGWQARSFRRVWRGSITVSFLNPIFFLLSIGVLLGSRPNNPSPALSRERRARCTDL